MYVQQFLNETTCPFGQVVLTWNGEVNNYA